MMWEKWVKQQLRAYMFRDIDRENILAELKSLDEDLVPSISRHSLAPGRTDRRGSIVEYKVLKRNKVRNILQGQLLELNRKTQRMDKALSRLSKEYSTLIKRIYFTLDKEENIMRDLMLTKGQFSSKKEAALSCLFNELTDNRYKVQQVRETILI
jgi:hypothetical protein